MGASEVQRTNEELYVTVWVKLEMSCMQRDAFDLFIVHQRDT